MLSNLPPILSGEQVRCILHIGKRKCAWMLNNGFIKCHNTGKKTRKYTVLKEDLLFYIEDSSRHPEKYATPYREFSSVKHHKPHLSKTGFPYSLPSSFRPWLEKEFEEIPDALTVPQIVDITGYADNSVDRWLRQGHIRYVNAQSAKIIAKDWLIDFCCTYGYTIAKMSEKHIALMKKFFSKQKIKL